MGKQFGICLRSHRAVGEPESGGEMEGNGVMGLPLSAETIKPAALIYWEKEERLFKTV